MTINADISHLLQQTSTRFKNMIATTPITHGKAKNIFLERQTHSPLFVFLLVVVQNQGRNLNSLFFYNFKLLFSCCRENNKFSFSYLKQMTTVKKAEQSNHMSYLRDSQRSVKVTLNS